MKPTVARGSRARAPSSIPRPARRTGTRQTGPEICSTSVCVSGVLMLSWRVGILLVASATMMSESSRIACRKSVVGVRSSRRTASLWRLKGPSTTKRLLGSLIEGEGIGELGDPVAEALGLAAGGGADDGCDLAHLVGPHPARGHGRRPEPDAARGGWGLGVVGDHVLVARHPDDFQRLLQLVPVHVGVSQVYADQAVIRAAGDGVQAAFQEPVGERAGVLDDAARVLLELGLQGLADGDGLACPGA